MSDILRINYGRRMLRLKAGHMTFGQLCNESWFSPIRNFKIKSLINQKNYYTELINEYTPNTLRFGYRLFNQEDAMWKIYEINTELRRLIYGYRY